LVNFDDKFASCLKTPQVVGSTFSNFKNYLLGFSNLTIDKENIFAVHKIIEYH